MQPKKLFIHFIHNNYITLNVQFYLSYMFATIIQLNKFGHGNSAELFLKSLVNESIWQLKHQKQFIDK
jgi:UDP-N-acetylglucosamine 2-epimerase (hydrolysing)